MLKQNTQLWNKVEFLLEKRKHSYLEVSKKLNINRDNVKYVAMIKKLYKKPYNIIISNHQSYNLFKHLIKKYSYLGYEEIANKINKIMHKKGCLPNNINITKNIIGKWLRKNNIRKNAFNIKRNSEIWRKMIKLLKLRKYSYQQIADMFNIKRAQIEGIAYKNNIKQTPFNTLILNPNSWNYFKNRAIELYNNDVKYKDITNTLNKELHHKDFLPKEITLTQDCFRGIIRDKLKLPIRRITIPTQGFNTYSKFIILKLKNKKVISKNELNNLIYKKFRLKKDSCEQIYMKLRWDRIIASSIQRPLFYTLVDWKDSKYKIEKHKNKNFIWFTGKGRFTNADLIKHILIEKNHPLTFGQIVREFKNKFNLDITGRDLGIIINNEHRKFITKPKIDIITHYIKGNLLFLYIIPKKVTIDKITPNIEKLLIKEYKKDIKDHLKGTVEGKELDKCLKNIACKVWNFKRDFVLGNKKRPDLINNDKIIEIKKVLDTRTINSIYKKYGNYRKNIEIWYIYKYPSTKLVDNSGVTIRPISTVLNEINKNNLSKDIIKDFKYIQNNFLQNEI